MTWRAPFTWPSRQVHIGHYVYRDNESAWVDPLDPIVTQYNYSTVNLNATSIDGEPLLQANFSFELGRVFTALDVDGQPTDEYVNGSLLNMTMVNASGVNGSTTFGLELFYVSTPG